jgi:pre-mRNA-processing factor 6
VTDSEWDSIPEVGNLTRKKRRKEERSFVVPDSVLVGDRTKGEFENALDSRQQEVCHVHINKNLLSDFLFRWAVL